MRLLAVLMAAAAAVAAAASVPGSEVETRDQDSLRHRCEQLEADWVNVSRSSQCLIVSENQHLSSISAFAFAGLPQLADVLLSENGALETIGPGAFSDLPELVELTITKSRHLRYIHPDAFRDAGKLQYLTICNTGLRIFPDLTKIRSAAHGFVLDLQENSHLQRVPANAFRGLCSQTIREIRLTRNGIKEVASGAFNGTKMHRLFLRGNQELTSISPQAFAGSSELVVL